MLGLETEEFIPSRYEMILVIGIASVAFIFIFIATLETNHSNTGIRSGIGTFLLLLATIFFPIRVFNRLIKKEDMTLQFIFAILIGLILTGSFLFTSSTLMMSEAAVGLTGGDDKIKITNPQNEIVDMDKRYRQDESFELHQFNWGNNESEIHGEIGSIRIREGAKNVTIYAFTNSTNSQVIYENKTTEQYAEAPSVSNTSKHILIEKREVPESYHSSITLKNTQTVVNASSERNCIYETIAELEIRYNIEKNGYDITVDKNTTMVILRAGKENTNSKYRNAFICYYDWGWEVNPDGDGYSITNRYNNSSNSSS